MLAANKKAVGAWLLYDLANTIFALGVIGLYFPAWLREEGGSDGALAITEAAAGMTVIALAAWLGARSDRIGRRLPNLAVATAVAIIATALLGIYGLTSSLVILGFGLVGFNLGSPIAHWPRYVLAALTPLRALTLAFLCGFPD